MIPPLSLICLIASSMPSRWYCPGFASRPVMGITTPTRISLPDFPPFPHPAIAKAHIATSSKFRERLQTGIDRLMEKCVTAGDLRV